MEGTRQSPVIGKIFKDGKQLTSKDVTVNVTDDKVTFTFTKPTHNQTGKYQIKLSNEQGEDTQDVNINMQGKIFTSSFLYKFECFFCCMYCNSTLNVLQTFPLRLKMFRYPIFLKQVANCLGNRQKILVELLFYIM